MDQIIDNSLTLQPKNLRKLTEPAFPETRVIFAQRYMDSTAAHTIQESTLNAR
jgi:hypothetical protein